MSLSFNSPMCSFRSTSNDCDALMTAVEFTAVAVTHHFSEQCSDLCPRLRLVISVTTGQLWKLASSEGFTVVLEVDIIILYAQRRTHMHIYHGTGDHCLKETESSQMTNEQCKWRVRNILCVMWISVILLQLQCPDICTVACDREDEEISRRIIKGLKEKCSGGNLKE